MYLLILLVCVVSVCNSFIIPPFLNIRAFNSEKNLSGAVDVGFFQGFTSDLVDGDYGYFGSSIENDARAGDGIAVSGVRQFFRGDTAIDNSSLVFWYLTAGNEAKADDANAVAGTQTVFSDIQGSTVALLPGNSDNKAVITNQPATGESTAIAGQQTQVAGQINDSQVYSYFTSSENIAKNKASGDAIGGDETAVASLVGGSALFIAGEQTGNYARADDGDAVAGSKLGAFYVQDSNVSVNVNTTNNEARAVGGNAVAGSENNFGSVVGSFPGGAGNVNLVVNSTFNKAVTDGNGTSVAGATLNVDFAQNADIDITSYTANNLARTRESGTVAQNAVAGLAVTVNDMYDTTLIINSTSVDNYAKNKAYDTDGSLENDAVAGFQLTVGNAEDSEIFVIADSENNKAVAAFGDAIAGNEVTIGYADSSTVVGLDLYASGNKAKSDSGNATISNVVNIGGYASLFYAP